MAVPAIQKLIRVLVADAAFALVGTVIISLTLASLSAAGVITMKLAIGLLIMAWLVGVGATFVLTHIWNPSHKHRALFSVIFAVFLAVVGWYEHKFQIEQARAALPELGQKSESQTGKPSESVVASRPMPLFGNGQPCSATFENLHAQAGRDFVNTPSGRSIGSLCIKQGDIKAGRDVFHEGDRPTTDQPNSSRLGPALPAQPTKK